MQGTGGYEFADYVYQTTQIYPAVDSAVPGVITMAWLHIYQHTGSITSPGPGQTNNIALIQRCEGTVFKNHADCDTSGLFCDCTGAPFYPGSGQGNVVAFFMDTAAGICAYPLWSGMGLLIHIDIVPIGADDSNCVMLDKGNGQITWDPPADWLFMVPSLVTAGATIGNYQGLWNAATNTPTLGATPTVPQDGFFWLASSAGTWASLTFAKGDFIMAIGGVWTKQDGVLFTQGCQTLCATYRYVLTDCVSSATVYIVMPFPMTPSGVIQINGGSSCYTIVGDYTPETSTAKDWLWVSSVLLVTDCSDASCAGSAPLGDYCVTMFSASLSYTDTVQVHAALGIVPAVGQYFVSQPGVFAGTQYCFICTSVTPGLCAGFPPGFITHFIPVPYIDCPSCITGSAGGAVGC
jgi:hypothetical protein